MAEDPRVRWLHLIYPGLLPMRVHNWLAKAGIHETSEVLAHIRAGTLQTLHGIGPYREMFIVLYHTDSRDWAHVRRLYG